MATAKRPGIGARLGAEVDDRQSIGADIPGNGCGRGHRECPVAQYPVGENTGQSQVVTVAGDEDEISVGMKQDVFRMVAGGDGLEGRLEDLAVCVQLENAQCVIDVVGDVEAIAGIVDDQACGAEAGEHRRCALGRR